MTIAQPTSKEIEALEKEHERLRLITSNKLAEYQQAAEESAHAYRALERARYPKIYERNMGYSNRPLSSGLASAGRMEGPRKAGP